MINKCPYCTYITDVKCNLLRHLNAKHKPELETQKEAEQNVCPNVQNVCPKEHKLTCNKCRKVYKTKRHLEHHELNCKGIDELTCSKCMISFTTRSAKHKHVKRNTCKARSIVFAREPNSQKTEMHTNIETQNIIHTQNIIQNQNNSIIINNFGNERIDHISHEDIRKILLSGIHTVPRYIEKKHFDKDFPENNNIRYTRENKCKVLENNAWKDKDIGILSSKLIKDNSHALLLYCDDNEIKLLNEIQDNEIYEHIKNKLILIYNKSDNVKYNEVLANIKDMIKNT